MKKDEIYNKINNILEYHLAPQERKKLISKIKPYLSSYSTLREVVKAVLKGTVDYVGYDVSRAKIWTEKNHNLEFYLHNAFTAFSNPKFVYIIRDPRDSLSSFKIEAKKFNLENNYKRFCLNIGLHIMEEYEAVINGFGRFKDLKSLSKYYKINHDILLKAVNNFYSSNRNLQALTRPILSQDSFIFSNTKAGRSAWNFKYMLNKAVYNGQKYPNHFMLIRYEDLVFNTKKVMKKAAKFLDINFKESLLAPTEQNQTWLSNTSYQKKAKNVSSKSVGKYKTELSKQEIKIIGSILKNEMKIFKYK